MGRKRKEPDLLEMPVVIIPETPDEAEAETQALREPEHGEKTLLVRKLLSKFPTLGNTELAVRFNEHTSREGVNMSEADHGPTFAAERSKAKKIQVRQDSPPAPGKEPTLSELRVVQAVIQQMGGPDMLRSAIATVTDLLSTVGGAEAVEACIEFWEGVSEV